MNGFTRLGRLYNDFGAEKVYFPRSAILQEEFFSPHRAENAREQVHSTVYSEEDPSYRAPGGRVGCHG